jgi:hypothetical protein
MSPTLYLFQSTSDAFYAVARDQTGCGIPKLNSGDCWLLRGEIRFDELPVAAAFSAGAAGGKPRNVWRPGSASIVG